MDIIVERTVVTHKDYFSISYSYEFLWKLLYEVPETYGAVTIYCYQGCTSQGKIATETGSTKSLWMNTSEHDRLEQEKTFEDDEEIARVSWMTEKLMQCPSKTTL